ncbi:unnamed protein product, partial [Ectocarpus sp. 8 AP-2014]
MWDCVALANAYSCSSRRGCMGISANSDYHCMYGCTRCGGWEMQDRSPKSCANNAFHSAPHSRFFVWVRRFPCECQEELLLERYFQHARLSSETVVPRTEGGQAFGVISIVRRIPFDYLLAASNVTFWQVSPMQDSFRQWMILKIRSGVPVHS